MRRPTDATTTTAFLSLSLSLPRARARARAREAQPASHIMTVDTRQDLSIIHRPKSFSVNTYNFVHAGRESLSGFHPFDANNRAPMRRLLGDTEG